MIKKTRILAIDGGGVRGLIPAVVLAYIERRIKQLTGNKNAHIIDYFDLFAGTSTGSFIIASLLSPSKNNKPLYNTSDVIDLYQDNIKTIFHSSLLENIKSVSGIMGVKYNPKGLKEVLKKYFSNIELKDLLKPCIIPSYDLERSENYYFKQHLASNDSEHNYYIVDVLRAATAAPTYFPPASISNVKRSSVRCFIDGGVFAVNPALSVYGEYRRLNPYYHAKNTMLLSLGTGMQKLKIDCEKTKNWSPIEWRYASSNILSTAIPKSSSDQLDAVYNYNDNYLRLNGFIDPQYSSELDNSNQDYLDYLTQLASEIIDNNKNDIEQFVDKLIYYSQDQGQYQRYHLSNDLDIAADKIPNKTAFVGLNTNLSYGKLRQYSLNLAYYLHVYTRVGVVGIMLPNLLSFPVSLFGVWYSDKIATLVNPLATSDELLKQCVDAGVTTIIIARIFINTLNKILTKTSITTVILVELGDLQSSTKRLFVNTLSLIKRTKRIDSKSKNLVRFIKFNTLIKQNRGYEAKEFDNDIALLQYTGGTSGVFKAAILSHKNISANIAQLKSWSANKLNQGDTILTALPLYHIFALTVNLLFVIHLKGCNVLVLNARDINQLIKAVRKHTINIITGVNTLFNAFIYHPSFKRLNWSGLKLSVGGGMAVDKKTAKLWQQQTNCTIIQGYGLSECSPVVSANKIDISDFDSSVGYAFNNTEIKIIKPDDLSECRAGEVGEICIKGPQVMSAYWQKIELNSQVFVHNRFFRSGDLGYLDKTGRLFIVDRLKDMIIVSGFNVYPADIESVLNAHLEVIESACIGVEDKKSGQAVKAFVVKKEGSILSEQQLITYCQEHLSHYKIPKYIHWQATLPKSNVGKILKRKLASKAN